MSVCIHGTVNWFGPPDKRRRYLNLTLTFRQVREAFTPYKWDFLKDDGEQREVIASHVRALRRELESGTFTPCALQAGLRPNHEGSLSFAEEDGVQTATVMVDPELRLPMTDGQQRVQACEQILADGGQWVLDVLFPMVLLLDTKTRSDFCNLQKGKPLDATHFLSVQAKENLLPEKTRKYVTAALEAARRLNIAQKSPYKRQVRFDSKGLMPLPFKTLCAQGASDMMTSLYGLARVSLILGDASQDGEWMGNMVLSAIQALHEKSPELLEEGKMLTPPPDGTKGSATMLLGVGTLLAYRVLTKGGNKAQPEDLDKLVAAASATLSGRVDKDFSGPRKRAIMGEFAREFLNDIQEEKHEGVPLRLIETLSASSMALSKPPKKQKESKRRRQPPPALAE